MFVGGSQIIPLYLIMPPQRGLLAGFATGLLCLQKHLRNVSHAQEVTIVDLSIADDKEAAETLRKLRPPGCGPAVFGITTTSATYRSSLLVAQSLKAAHGNDAVVILGGHHASADPRTVLAHHLEVDFVIAGEGETALEAFLATWPAVGDVPNLCRRDNDGQIVINAPAPLLNVQNLDALRLDPSWFLEEHHAGKFDRYTYVSARGCPLKCRFCSVADQPIRGKSAAVVAAEVAEIVEAGFGRITIEDNFFAHSPARTREICDALRALRERGLLFDWDCQTRVEAVARAGVADQLQAAGCAAVYLGVEALTAPELKFLGKAPNAQRYFRQLTQLAVPELVRCGIGVYANLQFGLPIEAGASDEDAYARLVELGRVAADLGARITVFPQLYVIYPGTAHFQEYVAAGVIWPSVFEDFSEWEHAEPSLVDWMGRHFAHGVGGIPIGILNREALTRRRFDIDWRAAMNVDRAIGRMAATAGISVFRYEGHLVESRRPRAVVLEEHRS